MYHYAELKNGLRVICETMPDVHSVSIGIWVASGSRHERPEEQGISHFVEHMMFKGTNKRTTKQIAEEIDAVGGQLNAFTTKEYTCYYSKVLAKHFDFGVDLLADMVTNSVFDPMELEKEKRVVLEEIKSFEDSPDEIIHDVFANAVLKGHPLGRAILGTPETVKAINRELVMDYLSRYYTPDNIVFAVAGNVKLDRVMELAENYFGRLQGNRMKHETTVVPSTSEIIVRTKETEQVHLCLGTRGISRKSKDKFVVFVLDSILGGSVSSRLFQQLREERGLVYVTGSNHAAYWDTGIFSIYAGTSLRNYEKVVGVIKKEITSLKKDLVTPAELTRVKEQLKGNLLLSLENSCNRMSRMAKTILFEERLLTPDEVVERIDQVTQEDIMRVSGEIFNEERFVLAALGPFATDSPFFRKAYHEY